VTAPQRVTVYWLDAWLDVGEASELDEHPRESTGYLVANGPKKVRIAQSWDESGGDDHLTIPTAMVLRIELLEANGEVKVGGA
jgi:hypothetical protein